jgi:triacylglycerol lipase
MSILTELPEPLYLGQRPIFQTGDTKFNPDTARAMAWAAQLAYETNDLNKVQRILTTWGWILRGYHAGRISSILPLTSAKGFIAAREGVSILTFAGTEPLSLADWILDFSLQINADGVHDGFETGVNSVWNTISTTLGAGGPAAADKLFITGHSLGGALAAATALRLAKDRVVDLDRILGVYTFGMPRTGNDIFAQDYRDIGGGGLADRTYRMIDGFDIVPQVPPSEAPFAFRHIGCALACAHGALFDPASLVPDTPEQVPLGESALLGLLHGLFRMPPTRDLPAFPGDPLATVIIESLPPSIRDHLMDRYLRALGGL